MDKYVKCVVVPHDAEPYIARVPNNLVAFQDLVSGYIETVTFCSDAVLIVNEEGLLWDMPLNESIKPCLPGRLDVYGTGIIVGVDGEEFTSLDDRIAEWFLEKAMNSFTGRI